MAIWVTEPAMKIGSEKELLPSETALERSIHFSGWLSSVICHLIGQKKSPFSATELTSCRRHKSLLLQTIHSQCDLHNIYICTYILCACFAIIWTSLSHSALFTDPHTNMLAYCVQICNRLNISFVPKRIKPCDPTKKVTSIITMTKAILYSGLTLIPGLITWHHIAKHFMWSHQVPKNKTHQHTAQYYFPRNI